MGQLRDLYLDELHKGRLHGALQRLCASRSVNLLDRLEDPLVGQVLGHGPCEGSHSKEELGGGRGKEGREGGKAKAERRRRKGRRKGEGEGKEERRWRRERGKAMEIRRRRKEGQA